MEKEEYIDRIKRLTELIRETKELIEDTDKLADSFTLYNYGLTVSELRKGLEQEFKLLQQEIQELTKKYEIH